MILSIVWAFTTATAAQSRANIGQPTSVQSGDTSRPAIPSRPYSPVASDSLRIIASAGSAAEWYRDLFDVRFDDSTSGPTIRAFFARYGARILGGVPAAKNYTIRVRDEWISRAARDALLDRFDREPGVTNVAPLLFRGGRIVVYDELVSRSRPAIPSADYVPTASDTMRLVTQGAMRWYRDLFEISFDDTTKGISVRNTFAKYGAQIVGGAPDAFEYTIRVTDPGAGSAAFDSLIRRLNAEPGVAYATPVLFSHLTPYIHGRYPTEGDASRPAIPASFDFPSDSSKVVSVGANSLRRVYRDIYFVHFDSTTRGDSIRAIFSRYSATIIGGMPAIDAYVIRTSDPGANYSAVTARIAQLRAERGVVFAGVVSYADPEGVRPDGW